MQSRDAQIQSAPSAIGSDVPSLNVLLPDTFDRDIPKGAFINGPTELLVRFVARNIHWNDALKSHPDVRAAFAEYMTACMQSPSILSYIARHTDPASPEAGFTRQQLELLMGAMVFRSYSTYIAIPQVVTDLEELGFIRQATIIAKNAYEEIGREGQNSHATLLFDSVGILANSQCCHYLENSTFHLARLIFRLRKELDDPHFGNRAGDLERLNDVIKNREIALPTDGAYFRYQVLERDFSLAVYFCNIAHPSIANYHDNVLGVLKASSKDPDKNIETSLLELATREASSVDEHRLGRLSYIGAWNEVVKAYLGDIKKGVLSHLLLGEDAKETYVLLNMTRFGWQNGENNSGLRYSTKALRRSVTAWSRAHGDDAFGKRLGWRGSAEQGHALEASCVASEFLGRITSPEYFAKVLRNVTALVHARLQFWDEVVARMEELGTMSSETNRYLDISPLKPKWSWAFPQFALCRLGRSFSVAEPFK